MDASLQDVDVVSSPDTCVVSGFLCVALSLSVALCLFLALKFTSLLLLLGRRVT